MSLLDTAHITCPYCGEANELVIDASVPLQEYIEDCSVCCRPIQLRIAIGEDGEFTVSVRSEDEGF